MQFLCCSLGRGASRGSYFCKRYSQYRFFFSFKCCWIGIPPHLLPSVWILSLLLDAKWLIYIKWTGVLLIRVIYKRRIGQLKIKWSIKLACTIFTKGFLSPLVLALWVPIPTLFPINMKNFYSPWHSIW